MPAPHGAVRMTPSPVVRCAVLCALVSAAGAQQEGNLPWNYDPDSSDGPMYWATQAACSAQQSGTNALLQNCAAEEYSMCAGQRQSPINIVDADAVDGPEAFLSLYIGRTEQSYDKIFNSGRGIEIEMHRGQLELVSSLFRDNLVLTRILHKMPAEHKLNGRRHDLEQQFVFYPKDAIPKNPEHSWTVDPKQVIVSLLYSTDGVVTARNLASLEHSTINQTISHFSRIPREGDALYLFNFNPLLDLSHDTLYVYEGSHTAPPCAENVQWILSGNVRTVSHAELAELRKGQEHVAPLPHGNSRPEMPLAERRVERRRLKNPTRTPLFYELIQKNEVEQALSGHAGVSSTVRSEKNHLEETLRMAVIGLGAVLALLVVGLLLLALIRYNMVPLVIVPAWLGGSLRPEQERWTTQFKSLFGLHVAEPLSDDDEEEDDEDEEEEEDEEDEEEEEEEN